MKFLSQRSFGLDIADHSIEALELRRRFDSLSVAAYGRVKLASGIVEDGRVLRRDALIEAIQGVLASAQPRPIKTRDVVLSIPESKTFIHVFQLPSVISPENIGESIQYEAEATIPVTFDQVYHDYHILERRADNQDVLYVAGFKYAIDDYRSVVEEAGLRPLAVEPESLALARAFVPEGAGAGVCIVDAGARYTTVTIVDKQGLRFSGSTRSAGDAFTAALVRSLNVDMARANELKRAVGLAGGSASEAEAVYNALRVPMEDIAALVTKAQEYCQRRTGRVVNRLITCGGTSLVPGFQAYLQKKFDVPVESGDPFRSFRSGAPKPLRIEHPVLYATVVGLARYGFREDNSSENRNNLLAHKEDHHAYTVSTPAALPKPAAGKQASGGTGRPPHSKRIFILIGTFVLLIAIFVVILLMSKGGDEPLIKFYSTNYQTSQTVAE
ncbi:MAG: pilus assembly protein PilM [Patescibacteria group bacterium]|nr:pilus assembly protein PilM [Patescibacteria group bacterium]MDD5715621.1 pilus assembly protein PilM [Patescibacteria group bacterium]